MPSSGRLLFLCLALSITRGPVAHAQGVRVGTYRQERASTVSEADGLPAGLARAIEARRARLESASELSGVRDVARGAGGELVAACEDGLFRKASSGGDWTLIHPREGARSWAPRDVRAVCFDRRGRLWFASPQGVGRRDGRGDGDGRSATWTLYTGHEGLPYNDFTCAAAGEDGVVWFGTKRGAIRFDGTTWEYRQGRRWLPNDQVRSIAVDESGSAEILTARGVGRIERVPMTLASKARFFEDEIDRRHRRTPYEFVLGVSVKTPGDASESTRHDSDNDGLWTAMYGAGECYAYAATKDPVAKKRATKAFEALRFLGTVTQGGSHPAPPGFVARSILPTSGRDPNAGLPERDRVARRGDRKWKVMDVRWPRSADGKWYWKCDTSSDELDGHYFLYARYHDLVAETPEEKRRVRDVVVALTDHLIEHGFNLVDHDGKPTRWARFGPEELNFDRDWWEERGLNSLSMLSYLKAAEHVSGDSKYAKVARRLIDEHGYAGNVHYPKNQTGPGTGNQSDDEMAFMSFYNLLEYETDPELRTVYAHAFHRYWRLERPELNPLFNFMYAAVCSKDHWKSAFRDVSLAPSGSWLEESIDSLKRYPLDRFDWGLQNSHRLDVVPLDERARVRRGGRGRRRNGKVLPIDERFVDHWNHDPWRLDHSGDGRYLADGASFLLPYYMGLYHGFIAE